MRTTPRLTLSRPSGAPDEVAELHAICSDPATWCHSPTGCFTDPAKTARLLARWRRGWEEHGLGP